jgi:iron complex outermembrane receptor protein
MGILSRQAAARRSCSTRLRCAALLLLLLELTNGTAKAQQADLTQGSLEDLMNVEVTSVSKKEQKISQTASAIFVITQEDIRQSGAANIPDLLRMVPGLDVAQINANTWAISSRGLNGQFSNELLVMVDGRNVYTQSFGGVFWDTLDIALENIERIEVIRGPGATVWGENAVNGVVNILLKNASETHGLLGVAAAGNILHESGLAQYGGSFGKRADYRAYSQYVNYDELRGQSTESGADGWHLLGAGFRADTKLSHKDSLTVQGNMYSGREGSPTPTITPTFPWLPVEQEIFVNLSGGFVQGIWDHVSSPESASTLMASYDGYERSDRLGDKRSTFNIDFHRSDALGSRHHLVWGAGYRWTSEKSSGSFRLSLIPADPRTQVFSGFAQDEIAAIPGRLYLTVGAKLESNTYSGFAAMPSARVLYQFNERQTIWAGVSRAVRSPADTDVSLRLNAASFIQPDGTPVLISVFGNPRTKDEGVIAYEAGYRAVMGRRLSVDVAAYYNKYDHQITSEPAPPFFESSPLPVHLVLPSVGANLSEGEAHGADIFARWNVTSRWTLSPSYDFERIHLHRVAPSRDFEEGPDTEGSDPRQHVKLRSHIEVKTGWSWETGIGFTDRLVAQDVPSYTRVDTGLTWNWKQKVSLSVFGQNLLQARHLEFVDSEAGTLSTLIRRSWYARMAWHF